jgi:hypothetical protein
LYTQDAYETLDTIEVFFDTQFFKIIMEEVNSGLRRQEDCRGMLFVASMAEGRTNNNMRRKYDYIGLLFVASMAEGMI